MSNEIIKRSSITELMSIADAFAKSGLFKDVTGAAQAIVKIQGGAEMGIEPFAAMSGIHIIQGKLAVGAGLMASRVKSSGKYDFRVREITDLKCSIDFIEGGKVIGNSTFTIEDAKKAGTQNIQKFPKNMLYARAMSNGVKWYTPDVFTTPVYTPEELGANTDPETAPFEDVKHEVVEDTIDPPVPKKRLTDNAVDKAIAKFKAGDHDYFNKLSLDYDYTEEQAVKINAAMAEVEATLNVPADDDIPA